MGPEEPSILFQYTQSAKECQCPFAPPRPAEYTAAWALYNQGRYREARALLEEWGEAGAASTEKALEGIRSAMTEEELEIYDPLEAYRQLVDWLE